VVVRSILTRKFGREPLAVTGSNSEAANAACPS
jgi:hypothetical protein